MRRFEFLANVSSRYVRYYDVRSTLTRILSPYRLAEVTLRKMSIGVPIKVLHEAEGHIVTCETNSGEVYRGKLVEAEDNMNCQVTRLPNLKPRCFR